MLHRATPVLFGGCSMLKADVNLVPLALLNRRLAECLDELEQLDAERPAVRPRASQVAEEVRTLREQRRQLIERMRSSS